MEDAQRAIESAQLIGYLDTDRMSRWDYFTNPVGVVQAAAAADQREGVHELPGDIDDRLDETVTVETGQLVKPPQLLSPPGVRLYGLDKGEPSRVEILDPVLSPECRWVVEYGNSTLAALPGQSVRAIW
jgi:hypothetical protein